MTIHPGEVVSSVCFGSVCVPGDIACDVFSRLDWKTISRCALVSHSWRDFLLSYLRILKEAVPPIRPEVFEHLENGISPHCQELGARWLLRQLCFMHCCNAKDVSHGKKSRMITRALCSRQQNVFAKKVDAALLENGGVTLERIGTHQFLLCRPYKETVAMHMKLPISCYTFDSDEGRLECIRTWNRNGTLSNTILYASHPQGRYSVFAERSAVNGGSPSVSYLKWCSTADGTIARLHDMQEIDLRWFEERQKCLCPYCGLLAIVDYKRLLRTLSVILTSPSSSPIKTPLPTDDLPAIIKVVYVNIQPDAKTPSDADCSRHKITLCFQTYTRTIRSAGTSYYHFCTFTLCDGGFSHDSQQISNYTVSSVILSKRLHIDMPGNFQMLESGSESLVCFTAKRTDSDNNRELDARWWLHFFSVSSLDLTHMACLQHQRQMKAVVCGTFLTICQEKSDGVLSNVIVSSLTGARLAVLPARSSHQMLAMVNLEFLNGICANEAALYWPVFVPLHFLST